MIQSCLDLSIDRSPRQKKDLFSHTHNTYLENNVCLFVALEREKDDMAFDVVLLLLKNLWLPIVSGSLPNDDVDDGTFFSVFVLLMQTIWRN
jgi:hypothetical protein